MKEGKHLRAHTAWFHLNEAQKEAKKYTFMLLEIKIISTGRMEESVTGQWVQGALLRVLGYSVSWLGAGCMGACSLCKNSSRWVFNICALFYMLTLKKSEKKGRGKRWGKWWEFYNPFQI